MSWSNKQILKYHFKTFNLPLILLTFAFIDEELFSGMYMNFMGTDAAIFRSLTKECSQNWSTQFQMLSGKITVYPFFWEPDFKLLCFCS